MESMSEVLVWFDGGCPLCRQKIALMRRLDRQHTITFLDVALDGTACLIDRAALLACFHALEDGRSPFPTNYGR